MKIEFDKCDILYIREILQDLQFFYDEDGDSQEADTFYAIESCISILNNGLKDLNTK